MIIDGRNLTLIYDGDKDNLTVAVDDLDITMGHKGVLGIMGPSGSGKSSLLYILSGLKKPTSGSIFYDGRNVMSFDENEMNIIRQNKFGFIFQRHYLIAHLGILENILLPLKTVSKENTDQALSLMNEMGILKYKDKKPGELSVGERQKAAILRALVNRPQVLFADEPTASLDMESALFTMELIENCMIEASVVVVTHDYKILKNAGRIIHIRDGKTV
jgi:ABC-type lipoprotein export system ATPase subunit